MPDDAKPLAARDIFLALAVLLFVAALTGPLLDLFDPSATPRPGKMPAGDYPAFWLAERVAYEGGALDLYDRESFRTLMIEAYGPTFGVGRWLYPPHFLMLITPLGALNYAAAWLVFVCVTFAGYFAAVRRSFAGEPRLVFLCMISPAVIFNLILGQTGFLTAGLLIGGYALMGSRPVLAGVCFGLLTVKPHLGLLVPFVLLFERRWTTIAAASATAAALAGVSVLVFGPELWSAFFRDLTGGDQKSLLDFVTGDLKSMLSTAYGFLRAFGVPHGPALAAQALIAAAAVFAAWRTARSGLEARHKLVIYVTLSLMMSPYLLSYDLPALGAAALAVAVTNIAGRRRPVLTAAAWTVACLPLLQIAANAIFGPVATVAALIFAALLVHGAGERESRTARPD